MSTQSLLIFGAATAVIFPTVIVVEGVRRPGYRAAYHTGSELALGRGGWIQRVNFLLVATGFGSVAIGVHRTVHTGSASALLGIAAFGLVLAALFAPDAVRGFPADASSCTLRPESVHAKLHEVSGPVTALALLGACLTLAPHLEGPWAVYTWATAVTGCVTTAWLIAAYRRDAPFTGAVQRALIGTYWLWIALLSLHLATA
jgi:Protein of unknown function (DUF998)